MTTTQMKKLSE